MKIGIDSSRAFLKNRTGIEEYSYQTIKNLRGRLDGHQVVLYLRKNQQVDFDLPKDWSVKKINCPRLWTQLGLSLEMLISPVDALFVPAHTVPLIHPKKTIVTMHGLEYEFCKNSYSFLERLYMRWTIKSSCRWASRIISVSENTKKDLMGLYEVPEEKISVIYEGYEEVKSKKLKVESEIEKPFLLFVGRIEERKNISNIINAFEILKEKYQIDHKLVLAGKPGHNYENIKLLITNSKHKADIVELGFVSEEKKWNLLQNADCFVFPTLYEGFGIPVLEAQSAGCPVVAADNSSISEVIGAKTDCNLYIQMVDPQKPAEIAEAIYAIISNESLKNDIIQKGMENVKRFSWEECAQEISRLITK